MRMTLKRICALILAITIMVSACCVSVFATQITTGNSGTTIYLAWSYYSDSALQNPASSLERGNTYFAKLSFYNNPTELIDSIQGFTLYSD